MSVEEKEPSRAIMAIDANWENWTVKEVIFWCVSSLNITENNKLCLNLAEQEITGNLLKELTLEDCKELCEDSNKYLAIRLKLMLNKLFLKGQDDIKRSQQESLVCSMENLYSTLTMKLKDFQTQYVKLRMDVLDVVKSSSGNNSPSTTTSGGSPTDFYQSRSQLQSNPTLYSSGGITSNSENHYSNELDNKGMSEQTYTKGSIQKLSRENSTLNKIHTKHSSSNNLNREAGNSSPNSEPLKQLRASKEDSCEKILRNAMKRHNLNEEDWRQYVLVICYGDQETVLELEDRPVVIFKNLKLQGLKPTIMLRHRGDFEELNVGNDGKFSVTPGGRL